MKYDAHKLEDNLLKSTPSKVREFGSQSVSVLRFAELKSRALKYTEYVTDLD